MIKYLAYLSFLVGVLDTMRDIDHMHIKRCISQSVLEPHWTLFEQYLLERSVYKALLEQSIASDLTISVCGYADCGKKEAKDKLRKCAGCEIVSYCSKDCQRADWKFGQHRWLCKTSPGEIRGSDKRETKYFDFIVLRDAHRHIKGLHQKAVKKYSLDPIPRSNNQPFGVSVDYRTIPPTLDVFSLEDDPYLALSHSAKVEIGGDGKPKDVGVETCIFKTILPRGSKASTESYTKQNSDPQNELVWENEFDMVERTRGLLVRPSAVDSDSTSLRVVSDQTDIILNKLSSSKVKIGTHFRWDACGQIEEGGNVVDEIGRLVAFESAMNDYGNVGNIVELNTGHIDSAKGLEEK